MITNIGKYGIVVNRLLSMRIAFQGGLVAANNLVTCLAARAVRKGVTRKSSKRDRALVDKFGIEIMMQSFLAEAAGRFDKQTEVQAYAFDRYTKASLAGLESKELKLARREAEKKRQEVAETLSDHEIN